MKFARSTANVPTFLLRPPARRVMSVFGISLGLAQGVHPFRGMSATRPSAAKNASGILSSVSARPFTMDHKLSPKQVNLSWSLFTLAGLAGGATVFAGKFWPSRPTQTAAQTYWSALLKPASARPGNSRKPGGSAIKSGRNPSPGKPKHPGRAEPKRTAPTAMASRAVSARIGDFTQPSTFNTLASKGWLASYLIQPARALSGQHQHESCRHGFGGK